MRVTFRSTLLGRSVFRRAVIILCVAVLTAAGRLVCDFSPVAVLVRLVVDDLFATVGQTDSVLTPGDGILVSFAPRLLISIIVDVELERVVVPALKTCCVSFVKKNKTNKFNKKNSLRFHWRRSCRGSSPV